MVSIKSLVLSTALLVAGASAAAVEKRGGGWGTATCEYMVCVAIRETHSVLCLDYYQNGNPGACGNYASDSDYVVALNSADYDNGMLFFTLFEFWLIFCSGAHCGKTVWVQSNESKKIVEAKIADLCPSCESSPLLCLLLLIVS